MALGLGKAWKKEREQSQGVRFLGPSEGRTGLWKGRGFHTKCEFIEAVQGTEAGPTQVTWPGHAIDACKLVATTSVAEISWRAHQGERRRGPGTRCRGNAAVQERKVRDGPFG